MILNLGFDISMVWKLLGGNGQETVQVILFGIFLVESCIELNGILVRISNNINLILSLIRLLISLRIIT